MAEPRSAPQEEAFTSDIRAFCALVSRIILRCLRERDEKTLQILGLSKEQQQKEFNDESAA